MKQWKKLAALALAGIMAFALAACVEAKETTATEATEKTDTVAPTGEGVTSIDALRPDIDPETYREYIGTWYADGSSASYRINVKDDGTWEVLDGSGEIVASGALRVNDDEELLELYDPDGSLAITIAIEEEGVLHVDIMLESLADSLSTNTFLNKITNDISDTPITDIEDTSSDVSSEEEVVAPSTEEETTN